VEVNQGNQPPIASAGGPYTADLNAAVTFNGTGSLDPNVACGDSITSYSWKIANGTFTPSGATPTLTASQVNALGVGTFNVVLTVTDTFNASSTDSTRLSIY